MSTTQDIWSIPAGKAPDGQESDFNSPENSALLFYAISSVFTVIAVVCVFLKLYVRIFVHKQPGMDDLCAIIALGLQISYTAITDNMLIRGGARHQWDMSLGKYQDLMKTQGYLGTIQMATYLFTKIALLVLYFRLFSPKPAFKWSILGGCAVVVCAYIPLMFIFIFIHTIDILIPASYGLACINLITDVYLWILPMAAIGSLKLPTRRKFGVAGLFSAGAV